jgi:hypothetical protein
VRGESQDGSLHLNTHGNAVERPTVSVLLEHGSPTVSLEVEGEPKSLIVDTGSNVCLSTHYIITTLSSHSNFSNLDTVSLMNLRGNRTLNCGI